jgi:hypothetical protein
MAHGCQSCSTKVPDRKVHIRKPEVELETSPELGSHARVLCEVEEWLSYSESTMAPGAPVTKGEPEIAVGAPVDEL